MPDILVSTITFYTSRGRTQPDVSESHRRSLAFDCLQEQGFVGLLPGQMGVDSRGSDFLDTGEQYVQRQEGQALKSTTLENPGLSGVTIYLEY